VAPLATRPTNRYRPQRPINQPGININEIKTGNSFHYANQQPQQQQQHQQQHQQLAMMQHFIFHFAFQFRRQFDANDMQI